MPKGSAKPFEERMNVVIDERNLFLGTSRQYDRFKRLMNSPIEVKGEGKSYKGERTVFDCTAPLQIRVMGEIDDVRDITKKIMRSLNIRLQPSPKSSVIGLSKLECDKRNRVGNYCSNTIRAYINPPSPIKKKAGCEKGLM